VSGGVLVFVAGGARLGVPLADVTRLTLEVDIVPVPFAHTAMAGLMRGDDGAVVPIFDLHGLDAAAGSRPRTRAAGATIAVLATARGPVGLRLDQLLGTASAYEAAVVDEQTLQALSSGVRRTLGGAGRPRAASHAVGDAPFFFFSAEGFIAAVDL
jgi:chemotaxis signal transduction protein